MKRLFIFLIFTVCLIFTACSSSVKDETQVGMSDEVMEEELSDIDLIEEATSTSIPTATMIPPTPTATVVINVKTEIDTPTQTEAPTPVKDEFTELKDIVYSTIGKEQKLDIYIPNFVDKPFPVLLILHQGGGQKEHLLSWGRYFVEQGYGVVAIDYRGWQEAKYPQGVKDAFCALAWIHSNASGYGFDPGNVFALGHSAGGTLAAMLGVVDDPAKFLTGCSNELPDTEWLQGVIIFTGIFDYITAVNNSNDLLNYVETLLGGQQAEKLERWQEASAISWVSGDEPPFLLLHGEADELIHPDQSLNFAEALRSSGGDVEIVIVPEAGHDQIMGSESSKELILEFLSHHSQ